nr:hypothetical protein CFP56_22823 [Quercus suber]
MRGEMLQIPIQGGLLLLIDDTGSLNTPNQWNECPFKDGDKRTSWMLRSANKFMYMQRVHKLRLCVHVHV